ncbi:pentatricopeptide repeat-containing protein At5g66520-like [Neltuma alba]|uniref:pentatricopeptide repeat-containing protein At5g66520-like n=1 Tax=Neltuma alba TaxID=207710 RepID=UPI0010A50E97|nr:pentatricopeptide repeat-containing protein At5g66520-like [Prosopis alba]
MSSCSKRCLLLLEKCKNMKHIKQAHAQVIACGLENNSFALSRVLAFFSSNTHDNSLTYAWKIFERIHQPTICIYNTIIKTFLLHNEHTRIISMFTEMLRNGLIPDNYTIPYALKACAGLKSYPLGQSIHGHSLKLGFAFDLFVGNSLMAVYCVCGDMGYARRVFDEMPRLSSVSWTVMISGYAKVGDVETARFFFDEAFEKDKGIWGAMISGYVQNNCFKEGLYFFRLMQNTDISPDESIFVSILPACAHLGALDVGIWIHRCLNQTRVPMSTRLSTSLLDMYTKCGHLDLSKRIFESMSQRDTICYNAMISGMAMHDEGENALKLFSDMEKAKIKPDDLTFLAVFTACSYAGMAQEGLKFLDKMINMYNIDPKVEHYGCLVDLLSRAGMFEEAKGMIRRISHCSSNGSEQEAMAWRAFLSACCNHGEAQMAKAAAERLFLIENHRPVSDSLISGPSLDLNSNTNQSEINQKMLENSIGAYVMLSNLYSATGNTSDARRVREIMKKKGVHKAPGCSSVEIDGIVNEFIAGEKTHPQMEEIQRVLKKVHLHFD